MANHPSTCGDDLASYFPAPLSPIRSHSFLHLCPFHAGCPRLQILLYWYKSTCFTGTKVQSILTHLTRAHRATLGAASTCVCVCVCVCARARVCMSNAPRCFPRTLSFTLSLSMSRWGRLVCAFVFCCGIALIFRRACYKLQITSMPEDSKALTASTQ